MKQTLTKADVGRLLADPSPVTRAETATKIAVEFDKGKLSPMERRIAEEIFRMMVHDAEVRVREALSHNLKECEDLPHDVALALAHDVDTVALPIIEYSIVLSDADLLEILRTQNTARQVAVARRRNLSATVSDALVDTKKEEVVVELVRNEKAKISERAFQKLLDHFGDKDAVKIPMVRRNRLPLTVAERLVAMVSENLRQYLVSHHELSDTLASDIILQSRERATMGLIAPDTDSADVEQLVLQMHAHKRLTPTVILRALSMGDLAFFEASLAVLAGIPLLNARMLIHDEGSLGFEAIYQKAGLPEALFPAMRVAVDVIKETDYDGGPNDRQRYSRRVIERILTQYENLGSDNLEYLLRKLKQLTDSTPSGSASASAAGWAH